MLKLTLLFAIATFIVGCHLSAASRSGEIAKGIARVKINKSTEDKAPIPLGDTLTIVNLFDEFSPGCPTGNRFETIERLNALRQAGTTVVLIFSDKQFSTQDLENFKAILPMADSLVQGDIEALRPQLSSGKLLVVLDSRGNVLWQEKPNTSEQQVFSELSKLMQ
jgi:hypothetical protein